MKSSSAPELCKWMGLSFLLVMLFGCGDSVDVAEGGINGTGGKKGSNSSNIALAGAVQKGPFIVGSKVMISRLDEHANSIGETIVTEVTNSIGSFTFTTEQEGLYLVVGHGYLFNELSGEISDSPLTLSALYKVTAASNQTVNVNVLTHLISGRVITLLKQGELSIDEAISKAETELVAAFLEALPIDKAGNFSDLSVYNVGGGNKLNTYLLAMSVAMYKHAQNLASQSGKSAEDELSQLINDLVVDLADDGLIQMANINNTLVEALNGVDPSLIVNNLKNRSEIDFEVPLDVPDISEFFGVCAGDADCAWSAGVSLPVGVMSAMNAYADGRIYWFNSYVHPDDGRVIPMGEMLALTYVPAMYLDVVTNEVKYASDMPEGVNANGSAVASNGKFYVIDTWGGVDGNKAVLEYTPQTDSWAVKSIPLSYRLDPLVVELGGKIYVFGGTGHVDAGPHRDGVYPMEPRTQIEMYDVNLDQWTTLLPLPKEFEWGNKVACSSADKIYIVGTETKHVSGIGWASAIEAYDPGAQTWTEVGYAPHFNVNSYAKCEVLNDELFALGSAGGPDKINAFRYNLQLNTFTELDFPLAGYRNLFAFEKVGEEMYLIGGFMIVGEEYSGEMGVKLTSRVDILDTTKE